MRVAAHDVVGADQRVSVYLIYEMFERERETVCVCVCVFVGVCVCMVCALCNSRVLGNEHVLAISTLHEKAEIIVCIRWCE